MQYKILANTAQATNKFKTGAKKYNNLNIKNLTKVIHVSKNKTPFWALGRCTQYRHVFFFNGNV